MRPNVMDTLRSLTGHLREHPETVLHLARHALRQRVAIPLDAIRWALSQIPEKKAPTELILTARPPSLYLDATFDVMGNPLRTKAAIFVEAVKLAAGELRLVLRLADVEAEALNPESPIAQILKSGALDLTKPANLLNLAPKKSPVVAAAKDDRIEIDLMRAPKFEGSALIQKALATVAPVLQVREMRTEGDWLLIGLRPVPSGLRDALDAVRS